MKSKEEILNDFGCPEVPFNENVTMYYPAILSAMEEYASQQAPASTPPVSANDMTAEEFFNHPDGMFTLNFLTKEEQETLYKAIDLFVVGKIRQTMLSAPVSAMEDETEKIFKPYCIDFFSKESEEERKIKIDFALNKKNESFSLFQSMYDQNYGSINIDENLVSIHTGGWSENEYLISIFKNTEWWRQNFRIQITGGHYYFDTDRINGMKEWDITKRISTTPTK